ncbi:hypothetical protein PG994_013436 [Apiospora phragmitis]|uniref:DUF7924 domain-containing protein n=1 Tax=Apiospora phragmitis TaxID=2905665 RepID=A0ABR1T8Q8_9PEZI
MPNLAYGYTTKRGFMEFSDSKILVGHMIDPPMGENHGEEGPFSGRSPWVATNQCLGGSATCVETAERLNRLLQQYPNAKTVENTSFNISMDLGQAKLHVSWSSDDGKYYMQDVRYRFDLENLVDYLLLRRYVKNMLDWGKGPRLRQFQDAFDFLLEEDPERASARARLRLAPSVYQSPSVASGSKSYQSGSYSGGGSRSIPDSHYI